MKANTNNFSQIYTNRLFLVNNNQSSMNGNLNSADSKNLQIENFAVNKTIFNFHNVLKKHRNIKGVNILKYNTIQNFEMQMNTSPKLNSNSLFKSTTYENLAEIKTKNLNGQSIMTLENEIKNLNEISKKYTKEMIELKKELDDQIKENDNLRSKVEKK